MYRRLFRTSIRSCSMAVVAAVLTVPSALAGDPAPQAHVVEWRSDQVRILDADGRTIDRVAADTLPQPPVPVLEVNDRQMARIATPRGEVWLAPTSIVLDRTAGILSPCERVERLRTANGSKKGYVSRGLSECN